MPSLSPAAPKAGVKKGLARLDLTARNHPSQTPTARLVQAPHGGCETLHLHRQIHTEVEQLLNDADPMTHDGTTDPGSFYTIAQRCIINSAADSS